jgi:hypothetical protein
MKTKIFTLLVVAASLHCWADPRLDEAPVVIGQPSVFWHNGEWQTYKDGVWTPYGKASPNRFSQARSKEGTAYSGPGIRDSRIARRTSPGNSTSLRREPKAGIGTTTIGIGQPNGIGQSTIGIGQRNVGIGQRNGIGQTTIGIGKPNVGIGQTTIGIGQQNIGIGQPNGIGRTTIGIGKPANFPEQQRSSSLDTTR